MSHFSSTRTTWTPGTALLAAEMADIDAKTFKAINGDEGGTWAPSSVITIGGSGATMKLVGVNTAESLFVDGTFDVSAVSNAYFRGSTQFRDGSNTTVREGASWAFNEDSSTEWRSGASLVINCDWNSSGRVGFSGPVDFSNNINFGVASFGFIGGAYAFVDTGSSFNMLPGSELSVESSANFSGSTTLSNAHISSGTISGPVITSSAGRVVKRYQFLSSLPSSTSAYGPLNSDVVIVNSLTSNCTFTINNSGAVPGDEMMIVNRSPGAKSLFVTDPSAGTIMELKSASGWRNILTIFFDGSTWDILHATSTLS